MDKKKYPAFTLIEMLIVMGILSVLMAIGVAVARFAIQRANNIQHQSAVDQMFQALQSHYTDNRRYPSVAEFISFSDALCWTGSCTGGVLDQYVDANFDGGAPARFYYISSTATVPQEFLVCVSYAQPSIATGAENLGGYCNGNGFGVSTVAGGNFQDKVMEPTEWDNLITTYLTAANSASEDWNGNCWSSGPTCP